MSHGVINDGTCHMVVNFRLSNVNEYHLGGVIVRVGDRGFNLQTGKTKDCQICFFASPLSRLQYGINIGKSW